MSAADNREYQRRVNLSRRIDRLEAEHQRLREALNNVCNELGVPQPGYLQPVANAYWIAREALADSESS